ncbi:MAG: 4Fe-4S dicluster domain-containing protein [Ignavibacteriales bacterium]|nr:4Fe-4S dicluster domain-containing protein [Ignavibacteriales bacterium]
MTSTTYTLTHDNLNALLRALVAAGKQLHAPQRVGPKVFFKPVNDAATIVFDYVQTAESPKSLLFPKAEFLVSYRQNSEGMVVTDHLQKEIPEMILFGSRPCDAAALSRFVQFFADGHADAMVTQRRRALTIISMSCIASDPACFCTSCGSSPGDTTGSDLLLTPISNGRYLVDVVTEKGQSLVAANEALFEQAPTIVKDSYLATVEAVFTPEEITKRLATSFNDPIWKNASLRCIGCGACAYVCPTCSCFTIEDEGNDRTGDRLRCWDSCAFALFTVHTTGHNPRPTQTERWRQRVMHKFSYLPETNHFLGCVGCGRCSRACPADMNLKEQIIAIAELLPAIG